MRYVGAGEGGIGKKIVAGSTLTRGQKKGRTSEKGNGGFSFHAN